MTSPRASWRRLRRRGMPSAPAAEEAQEGAPPGLELIRIEGGKHIYHCAAGYRIQIGGTADFERLGYEWSWVRDVPSSDPLAQLPRVPPSTVPGAHRAARRVAGGSRFRSFDEFLALAMTDPNLLASPFAEEDRRVIAYMDYLRDRFAAEQQAVLQDELVSVVMPTFERADVLERSMRSVLRQSYRQLELIVVDDGSRDGTEAVVRSFDDERVRYIRLAENVGNAGARNVGLEAASGDWIGYLDSDDTWHEHFLLIMRGELRRHEAEFAYAAQLVLRPPVEGQDGRERVIRFAPYHRGLLENNNYISMISVLHRRSLLDRTGGFDESFRRYVDWEFFLRLTAASVPIAVPVILSTYYQSGSPMSVSQLEDRARHLDLIRRRLREGRELATNMSRPADPVMKDVLAGAFANPVSEDEPVVGARDVTIVIPSYEAAPYLRACVDSVTRLTPAARLVVVDNASGAEVQGLLDELEGDGVTVIRNPVNNGFSYAANQGIDAAGPRHDVVLLNNDTLVTPGWLAGLQRVARTRDDVGLVAPRQVLPAGAATIKQHVPGADPTRECDTNLSAHHGNVVDPFLDRRRGWVELRFAPFFCVLITRDAIDRCGPLDHVNAPHYRSDRIYCDAVRSLAGLKIVYTPESKVYHFVERSTRELLGGNPDLFSIMAEENDWQRIQEVQQPRDGGADPR